MTEETRIIIKNKLIKKANDSFKEESPERNENNRLIFILGARQLLLSLSENNVLDLTVTDPLFTELDIEKVNL